MTIYRHKLNKQLYTIIHLKRDIRHTNRGAFCGIYAHPYLFNGEIISFLNRDETKCLEFINNTFVKVAIK